MHVTRTSIVLAAMVLSSGACRPAWSPVSAQTSAVKHEKVYPLSEGESVFAYSRISPDGRFLVYSQELKTGGPPRRIMRVIDLEKRATVFSEDGIDGYWSPDGERVIYVSYPDPSRPRISLWSKSTGDIARDVAPEELGDYLSWSTHDGRDLIMTILGRFYYLDRARAVLPAARMQPCWPQGAGERPLISKDGTRATVFLLRRIVVRSIRDCSEIVDTGIAGGKADFSWDGRYVAFHAPKPSRDGYEVQIVDLTRRTVKRLTGLQGSSLFPSWTRDGRLSYRYDGPDYRGFMMASNVLSLPESPLPNGSTVVDRSLRWPDVFVDEVPRQRVVVVGVWATWSAHSPDAMQALQALNDAPGRRPAEVAVVSATDIGSRPDEVARARATYGLNVPQIRIKPSPLTASLTANQMPMTLLFVDGALVGERLGAQRERQLRSWLQEVDTTRQSP